MLNLFKVFKGAFVGVLMVIGICLLSQAVSVPGASAWCAFTGGVLIGICAMILA